MPLQSPVCGPEGFRSVAPRHRPIHPGHLHRVPAISHGDSSVRPTFHSPRRLDDLIRSSGCIPPGSDPSGIASVSSLHHGRSLLSVQGAVLRVDNCPSGLYTADGSNIRHSPSLRYQDAQIPRRLVDSSRIRDHLSPGVGQAPASVRGAGTTSQFQKVVLDPISGHDLSRHADPVSSVHCKTDRDKGRKSPQDHRGVSFIPGPPSSSMASSSRPPFIPYSSGEGWDVQDAVSPDSPQVLVGLPRRIASHPLGSSVSGGSFMAVLGDSETRGRRSFPPGARLELLRRLGLSPQRQDDRSLLRQCHNSHLPQAIGRHEVSGPVPHCEGDSPVGRIHEDHATSPVLPGRVLLKLRASHNYDLTHRPLLASKRMFSRSAGTSIRHSNRTTQTSRSAAMTAFQSVSRKSPYASSDCVVTLKRFAGQAGFSETVAGQLAPCRRKSTRLNYQPHWGKFRNWCRVFHHRSSEPTILEVAEFFYLFYSKQRRLLYRLSRATERCFLLCFSSVYRRFRLRLFSRTWCAPLSSQLLAHYIIRLHGIWTRFWSTCQALLLSLWEKLPLGISPGRHCSS